MVIGGRHGVVKGIDFGLSHIYQKGAQGEYDRSVPLLERCLRVDADDWRCLDTYAEYLMARGDRGDTARDLMARGLAAVERLGVPESPKTLVFRGKALVMLGELDAGCALFDRCVERDRASRARKRARAISRSPITCASRSASRGRRAGWPPRP